MSTQVERDAERATLRAKRSTIQSDIEAIEAGHEGRVERGRYTAGPPLSAGETERLDNLRRGLARIDEQETALRAEARPAFEAMMRTRMMNPKNTETVDQPTAHIAPATRDRPRLESRDTPWAAETRSAALRTIDAHRVSLDAAGADRLDEVIRRPEAIAEAAYIVAVGNRAYFAAFAKLLRDPQYAKLRMTAAEEASFDAVSAAQYELRGTALAIGSGSTGGFALPFDLDPTLTNVAGGANCPLRRLARVQVLTGNQRHFVNADGVVASYGAEASAVSEAGPTFSQPTLTAARGSAFITASIETMQDYDGIVADLTALIADGRDTVDATKFLSGDGSDEPLGIATVGTAGALTTSQRVQTATADVVAVGDVYALYNAIPPRFQEATAWVSSAPTYSFFYRLTPAGSETEPQLIPSFGGPLLGKPAYRWSTMPTAAASGEQTGNKVAIAGDWQRAVTIGDRLGMTIEIIPNMLNGATPSFPTGQRGIVAWWRTGVVVHNVNALRYLEVA